MTPLFTNHSGAFVDQIYVLFCPKNSGYVTEYIFDVIVTFLMSLYYSEKNIVSAKVELNLE